MPPRPFSLPSVSFVNSCVLSSFRKGFEDDQIEALLHKIEIQMKHQSASFGMALTSYIASCWNHDGDPVELLQMGSQLTKFRKCLKENPKFLQEKVEQYFKVRNVENLLSIT